MLAQSPDELFDVKPVAGESPAKARIHASVTCSGCGEKIMEIRVRRLDGQQLCEPCFEASGGR